MAALLSLATLDATLASPLPPQCSAETPSDCLDGVSTSVTSLDSLRITTNQIAGQLQKKDESKNKGSQSLIDGDRITGLSSGDLLPGWTVWGSFGYSNFESRVAIAQYDATKNNFLVGLDKFFTDRLVAGVAFGYELTDANTTFNGGNQDTDGFTVAPYAAFLISDIFSVDANIGYTTIGIEQNRIDPTNAANITADFDSSRIFGAVNFNAVYATGKWVFGGVVGLLYAAEEQDAYTEIGGPSARSVRTRDVDLTQGYAGIDVGYSLGAWEPYAIGIYRNDFSRDDGSGAGGLPSAVGSTTPDDDDEIQYGLGVRYFDDGGITGSVEFLDTVGRSLFDDTTITLTVRIPL